MASLPVKRLSREAFERAREFCKTEARPLDRALFEYYFEDGPAQAALVELARFQNDDGGFGHALEPDLRTPMSSALATSHGLAILKDLGCPADHPMVKQAIDFLAVTWDVATRVWRVVPFGANDSPHAPWWHDDGTSLARTFDGFRLIPRAELASLLCHYAALVPEQWLAGLVESTAAYAETVDELGGGGGSDLVYTIHLAGASFVPDPVRARLVARVRAVAPRAVVRDPGQWSTYCITPLKLAPSPKSLVADLLQDVLPANLDYEIESQTADGCWEPTWTWGAFYPDVWKQARIEWCGILTLETCLALRAFDRLAL